MEPTAIVPVARTTRNGAVESIHHGVVVALDADGTTAWSAGDPSTAVYPRSSLKPLQAQALLDAGVDLAPEEIAIACASHAGTPSHIAAVERLLGRFDLTTAHLRNTPAWPLDVTAAHRAVRAHDGPAPVLQNCSGKHASMLATCVVKGWSTDDYLDPQHPVQHEIDAFIAAATGGIVHTGIDGCGAPTAMVTLVGLAQGVRDLAMRDQPAYRAMIGHPDLVDGDGRADTMLMRAVPGLVAKGGADGVYIAAHADGRAVALKIADGGDRAKLPVMLAALRSLGFDVGDVPVPGILGHGRMVGAIEALVPHA